MGSKTIADGDCSHEIKRHLLLGRKALTNIVKVKLLSHNRMITKLGKAETLLIIIQTILKIRAEEIISALCASLRRGRRVQMDLQNGSHYPMLVA